jgi:lysophospholipase
VPDFLTATSDDGTRLRVARWGEADRDILLIHGFAEHIGRYEHVAAALVKAGWRVTMPELRGHGQSEGKRGHTIAWHRYVEDVQATAAMINRPFVMVAHSMGGLVALATLAEPLTPACRALALSNPLTGVLVKAPAWKTSAAGLLSKIWPSLHMSNEIDARVISRDPEVVRAYEADPLVFSTLTPRWYTEMVAAQAAAHAAAPNYKLPLRLMVSDGDRLCNPTTSRELASRWGGPKEVVEYGPLYHELFNEPEKEQVFAGLVEWLEKV